MTNLINKKTVRLIGARTVLLVIVAAMLLVLLPQLSRRIPIAQVESWLGKSASRRTPECIQGIYMRYVASREDRLGGAGHTVVWKAPGMSGGIYLYYDPIHKAIYGRDGSDWYRLGEGDAQNGKVSLMFPRRTRFVFVYTPWFSLHRLLPSPHFDYINVELPEVPPQVGESQMCS